jgi:hypothetical protein
MRTRHRYWMILVYVRDAGADMLFGRLRTCTYISALMFKR